MNDDGDIWPCHVPMDTDNTGDRTDRTAIQKASDILQGERIRRPKSGKQKSQIHEHSSTGILHLSYIYRSTYRVEGGYVTEAHGGKA